MTIALMDAISWKFTGKPWDLNSYPLTPDEVWAKLDLPPEEVRAKLNEVITILNSTTDGASGGDNVVMTPIAGLSGSTVQAITEDLKNYLDTGFYVKSATYSQSEVDALLAGIIAGQIPDGSLTNAKLAADAKVGSLASLNTTTKTDLVSAVNEHLAETATLTTVGHVQLQTAIDNSETKALTPNALFIERKRLQLGVRI